MGHAAHHPSPAALLRRFGLRPRRRLGQHFLSDARIAATIARAVGPADVVVEIGAGLGALTAHLLDTAHRVVAVERDPALVAALHDLFAGETRLRVVHEDALAFDYAACKTAGEAPPAIAGNLPYNVSAPVLFRLLEVSGRTGAWTLMVQREVARRLKASPGGRDYGVVTALVHPHRVVEVVTEVGRGAFHPPPKVDSTVLRLVPRPRPLYADLDYAAYRRVVRAAFATRRKTVRNSFKAAGLPEPAALLKAAGIDPDVRGETLSADDFAALARALGPGPS